MRSRGREHASERPVVQQPKQKWKRDDLRLAQESQGEEKKHGRMAGDRGLPGVPHIGMQRQEKEQHAQNVLALRRPGDRLDIDGMERKQGGDHQAAPAKSRDVLEEQEQKHGVTDMQQSIDGVMTRGIYTEECAVERMRQPR